jgi:hypothetical protein
MGISIKFHGDKAIVSLSGEVSRDGVLLEEQSTHLDRSQYPATQRLYALLPEVLAELAPGYIERANDMSAFPGR